MDKKWFVVSGLVVVAVLFIGCSVPPTPPPVPQATTMPLFPCEGSVGGAGYHLGVGQEITIQNTDGGKTIVRCTYDGKTETTVIPAPTSRPPTDTPTATPRPPVQSPVPPSVLSTMLIGRDSRRCLAVIDSRQVAHRDCNHNDGNQQWQLASLVLTEIRLAQNQTCLTVDGGDVQAHYYVSTCSGQANQRWSVTKYGSWIQLGNQFSNKCIDVRQWEPGKDAEIFQWHCKPILDDKELDNQLWIQSNVEDVADLYPTPVPPPGVYVIDIQPMETSPEGNKKCFTFRVTFFDIGGSQRFLWWVQLFGVGGETSPKVDQVLGTGTYNSGKWCVGFTTAQVSAKVLWWRNEVEPHQVPFRDSLGRKPTKTFKPY